MRNEETFLYQVGLTLAKWTTQLFHGEGINTHYIPSKGPCLIASNHASYLDPLLVGAYCEREIRFLARKTLFSVPLLGTLIERVHAIPINREGSDVQSFKTLLQALKGGHAVFVFPEGTRSPNGSLQPAKPGVGMLACMSQVPVIPVRIFGSFHIWGKGRIIPRFDVNALTIFGKPLYPKEYDTGKSNPDRHLEASKRILQAIAEIQPFQSLH